MVRGDLEEGGVFEHDFFLWKYLFWAWSQKSFWKMAVCMYVYMLQRAPCIRRLKMNEEDPADPMVPLHAYSKRLRLMNDYK